MTMGAWELTAEQRALLPSEADVEFYDEHGYYISREGVVPDWLIELAGDGEIKRGIGWEVPTGAARAFGFFRKAGAISAMLGPLKLFLPEKGDFTLALFEKLELKLVAFHPARFGCKAITADGVAIRIIQAQPTPFAGSGIGGVQPLEQFFVILGVARCQE